MSKGEHICGSCINKKCPNHGDKTWDRVAHGPTTGCMRYWPKGWTGKVFAPLYWFVD